MLLQQQGSRVELTRPQVSSKRIEEMSTFINIACLYLRIKMTEEEGTIKIAWVLLYV